MIATFTMPDIHQKALKCQANNWSDTLEIIIMFNKFVKSSIKHQQLHQTNITDKKFEGHLCSLISLFLITKF